MVKIKPRSPKPLQQLIEMIKNPAANSIAACGITVGKEDKVHQSKDKKVSQNICLLLPQTLLRNLIQYIIALCASIWLFSMGREEFNNVESIEPDPTGIQEHV